MKIKKIVFALSSYFFFGENPCTVCKYAHVPIREYMAGCMQLWVGYLCNIEPMVER